MLKTIFGKLCKVLIFLIEVFAVRKYDVRMNNYQFVTLLLIVIQEVLFGVSFLVVVWYFSFC